MFIHVRFSLFSDLDNDERVSKLSQLKAQLITCFEPEAMKDILFELHEIPPEQSHAGVSIFRNPLKSKTHLTHVLFLA